MLSQTATVLTAFVNKIGYAKSKYFSVTNREEIDNWSLIYCLFFVLPVQTAPERVCLCCANLHGSMPDTCSRDKASLIDGIPVNGAL